MKRSQLKRYTPLRRFTRLKRYTPMRRMSVKREIESKIYAKLRKEFLAAHPFCEVFDECTARSRDVHHTAGRGKNYLVVELWKAGCRKHHKWVHRNPREAREAGLLV